MNKNFLKQSQQHSFTAVSQLQLPGSQFLKVDFKFNLIDPSVQRWLSKS